MKINKHDEYDTMGKKRLEVINGFRRLGEEEVVVVVPAEQSDDGGTDGNFASRYYSP